MPKEAIPEFNMPKEEGYDEAWRIEIERRMQKIRDGKAKFRPIEEFLKELRERRVDRDPPK